MEQEIMIENTALGQFVSLLIEAVDSTNEQLVEDLIEDGATVTEMALYKDFFDRFMMIYSEMLVDMIDDVNSKGESTTPTLSA